MKVFAKNIAMKSQSALCLLACLGTLITACMAAASFYNRDPYGFVWLAVSGILLTLVAPAWGSVSSMALSPQLNLSIGRRKHLAIGVLVVGTLLLLESAHVFTSQLSQTVYTTSGAWTPFSLGLILWIAGGWLLTTNQHPVRLRRISFLLLLILAIAVFLRAYSLQTIPTGIWYDEAVNGLEARHMLHDIDYRPVFVANMGFPHLALYTVMLGFFGETNITAIRLVAAAFAVGSVLMGYMVGCQIRGHFFGLLMALILATMRWSINFSRMAMNGVEVVFFILAALYFLIRLVQNGHMRDAIWAGLTIGTGLWFYRAFQLTLVAYVMFILGGWTYRPWKRTMLLALTLTVNVLVVLLPLIIFALTRPEYFDRVQTVSILNESAHNIPLADALIANLRSHLEMFHMKGDPNGRHNLPGEPMLDLVTGLLFGLGLFVSFRQRRNPYTVFFIAILVLGLDNGILSLPFEAPQSLRAIGVLPAIAYFSAFGGLALGQTLWQQAQRLPRLTHVSNRTVASFAVLGLGLILTWLNYDTYFNRQQTNYSVWIEYSTYETLVGRFLTEQSDDTVIYVSPFVFRHLSSRFLAEDQTNRAEMMKMPDVLPIRTPPEHRVLMIFVPLERMLYEYAQRLYPNATFRTVTSRDYGIEPPEHQPELFYIVELQPEDIAALQGLASDGSGIFYAPEYRMYQFAVPEHAAVTINGQLFTENEFSIQLPQGANQISIDPSTVELLWRRDSEWEAVPQWLFSHLPTAFEGVRASYFASGDWEGRPVTIETHPFIYQYIQILPMERLHSVIYSGQIYISDPGNYIFYLTAIDYARLSIDGALVVETDIPNRQFEVSLSLTPGWHEIEVRRQDLANSTFIYLEWLTPRSDQKVPVPMDHLRPVDTD